MTLQVIGAGLPRTGTHSLKLALELLLNARCYHMMEVFDNLDHVPVWREALDGESPRWSTVFEGYGAAVDYPAAAFWRELSHFYPGALILLSVRADAETWWASANQTVLEVQRHTQPAHLAAWSEMSSKLFETRLTPQWNNAVAAMGAYERHNAEVRAGASGDRFLEWQPGDGWAPLCGALDLSVPDLPFPHVNTAAEFVVRAGDEFPGV